MFGGPTFFTIIITFFPSSSEIWQPAVHLYLKDGNSERHDEGEESQ